MKNKNDKNSVQKPRNSTKMRGTLERLSQKFQAKPHLTTQIVLMASILVVAVLLGLLVNFRLTGIVLATTLVILAFFRFDGRAKVFSARGKKFDIIFMLSMAGLLYLFTVIAPY